MNNEKEPRLIRDYIPFRIDGCEVEVYFPSAYDNQPDADPADLEQTLIAAYQVTRKQDESGFQLKPAM